MNKILLIVDAINLNMPALNFACFLGRLTKSRITGVFLENLVPHSKTVLNAITDSPLPGWGADENLAEMEEKRKVIEQNIMRFKQACESRACSFKIHRDRAVPASEIISESRFADLIVVDAATSFNKNFEGVPTDFVKDILKDAECPVIIAPASFEGIDEIIFTYDKSRSSVFAIKQFSYLLPELKNRKVTLLQVNEKGEWADKDKYNLAEWLKCRYPASDFVAIKGDADSKLFDYMVMKKNILIVMGAYGRSTLSGFFKRSHADQLIKTITQPIFISHY